MNPFQKKKKKAYKITFNCGRDVSTIVWGYTAEKAVKALNNSYSTHIYIHSVEELKDIPQ